SSRRRHTRCYRDWSSDVCSSDLGLVFNQIEIKLNDFSHRAAEALEVGLLPLAEVLRFFVREVFLFILGGIVDAVAELVAQEEHHLVVPRLAAIARAFNRSAEISQHKRWEQQIRQNRSGL